MAVKERLIDIFNTKAAGPFLFLGSGFSRQTMWNFSLA